MKKSSALFCLLCPILIELSGSNAFSFDSPEYTLDPIIQYSKDASPIDLLSQDPILPVQKGDAEINTTSGSVQHTLTNELPYSVTDPSRPGSLSQFRGLGRSADETNVQSLGIPLNYAQGGGFDFSTFPQFFWADYKFQAGPSSASFDPRGISGTLTLNPWTAKAISSDTSNSNSSGEVSRTRITGLYSDANLTQISAAAKYGDRIAMLVGNSSGVANGPTGSLSARVYDGESLSLKFHLLVTKIDSELAQNPPLAIASHMVTIRTIPVVQSDWKTGRDSVLKSSVFYDNAYLRNDQPSFSTFSTQRIEQVGIENAFVVSDWKFGASSREIRYHQVNSGQADFTPPQENISSFQVSKLFVLAGEKGDRFILEPTIQAINVSDFGLYPEGTLGLRQEFDSGRSGIYLRGNFSRRFPSIIDRYFSTPASSGYEIIANPNLTVEKDLTAILGVETNGETFDGSLQGYYQVRYGAEVPLFGAASEMLVQSDARLFSLVATGGVHLNSQIRLFDSANFTHSSVDTFGSEFPYVPKFIDVLGLEFQVTSKFAASAQARYQSQAYVSSTTTLTSVAYLDLDATYLITSDLKVLGRIENVTGGNVVLDTLSPAKGRVFSVAVAGSL